MPAKMDIRIIMKYMENDKKKKENEIYMVIMEDLGKPIEKTVPI
jgi:3-dehydroquinate synthetase